MGKSYRKSYSACTGVRSAAEDKRYARRCWRRMQEQALRDCQDWEELVVPKRLEAEGNEVYGWGRDGKQTFQGMYPNIANPYWVVDKWTPWTEEQLLQHRDERVEGHIKWLAEISRK